MTPRCRFRKSTTRKTSMTQVTIVMTCRMGVPSSYIPSHCMDCPMREE